MDALPDTVDFNIAWGTQLAGVRFPTLLEFAGGLACPFPTTATTESDFSVMNRERDESRRWLEDLPFSRRNTSVQAARATEKASGKVVSQ